MFESVKSVVGRDTRDTTFCECRRCGTTLDADDERCQCCGSDDVAEYAAESLQ
ncbi:hypothetical protein [Haloprofundus marisrubri]|uniref:hypothetical protein n=1 Tax=Haloprofundus marisrubri TaxID=1514971 RepID=UPI0014705653|nr:hypothetical protein [Haloprofundus marisrubri]